MTYTWSHASSKALFPNYTQMIPADHQTDIQVSTAELMQCTRMASFFARDGANVIKLEATPDDEKGNLTITATATELGDNRSDLEAQVTGEETLIAFNARYLLDCINAINSPDMKIELAGSTSPGVIRPTDDTDYVHVIMPMHTVR